MLLGLFCYNLCLFYLKLLQSITHPFYHKINKAPLGYNQFLPREINLFNRDLKLASPQVSFT